ncbi:MAG TPA: methyltransferase domain-containing protein [Caldilineae bacterium]|nr:methyltransferase domain-containing protein [Caldilineae bacterium]
MSALYWLLRQLGLRHIVRLNKAKRLSDRFIRGFYVTHALLGLASVGFLQELGDQGSVDLAEFASREGIDLEILTPLCEYLYGLKILRWEGQRYALDTTGELISDMLMGALLSVQAYANILYHLEPLLRGQEHYGSEVRRRPRLVAEGSGLSAQLLAFPLVASLLRKKGSRHVLDLACGDGTFLEVLCSHDDRITGYGLDIAPEAIELGRRRLATRGLEDRIHLFVADMFRIDEITYPLPEIDAITCIYALHEFLTENGEQVVELLRKLRGRFPQTPLIVCEVIRHSPDELRRKPGGLLEIQLVHALSGQRLGTRQEWREIFRRAGFTEMEERYLGFVRTDIFTVR